MCCLDDQKVFVQSRNLESFKKSGIHAKLDYVRTECIH